MLCIRGWSLQSPWWKCWTAIAETSTLILGIVAWYERLVITWLVFSANHSIYIELNMAILWTASTFKTLWTTKVTGTYIGGLMHYTSSGNLCKNILILQVMTQLRRFCLLLWQLLCGHKVKRPHQICAGLNSQDISAVVNVQFQYYHHCSKLYL